MQRATLVLGGGGVKGLAHIGAWKAVEEAGLEVSGIVGTSIGALVGACVAGGRGWRDLVVQAMALQKRDIVMLNRWVLLFNGIRQSSMFVGERFERYIERVLPVQRFDELGLPLSMNAVDLETGQTTWFGVNGRTDVPLAQAVYASCAVPVFYPPAEIDGRHYVDGGVGDTLPLDRAAQQGAELIVAVDVAAGEVKDSLDTMAKGMIAIQHRIYDIVTYSRRVKQLEAWDGPPLVYVRPALDGYSTFDFINTKYFLEEGYRATRRALAERFPQTLPAS